jgi:hypothetical protein
MSAYATYLLGWIIIVVGLAWGAYLLNVPLLWAALAAVVLIALGIIALGRWLSPPGTRPD